MNIRVFMLAAAVASAAAGDALLPNGDFEHGRGGRPEHWQKPDGLGARWAEAPEGGDGKAICLDTRVTEQEMCAQWRRTGLDEWIFPKPVDDPIARTYGLSFYSDPVPVDTGRTYRVSFDYRTTRPGEGGKVWVRAYGQFRGRKRRLYETVVWCRVKDTSWHHFEETFHPARCRKDLIDMKVMLFATFPPAEYWFDNVVIEEVE